MNVAELRPLIQDDRSQGIFRVNRRVFTDPAILEMERREVFDRTWLYAAHESEFAKPGSYVTRKVGGRPLILVRDQAGAMRGYLNSCPHRGNMICRERSGSTRIFTCFYHAWAFNTEGKLVGMPEDDAYTPAFDRAKMGLTSVPRLESYRGLIFVSFDPAIVSLEAYLGSARQYIDFMFDYADEFEICKGSQSYSMKANWKLLVENSIDAYHGISTHGRYFRQFLPHVGIDNSGWANRIPGDTRGIALENGHALMENPQPPTPLADGAKLELQAIREKLATKFGPERAMQIAGIGRNLFIFPNLIMISVWNTIRTFYPISPDYMEIDAWAVLPRNESSELRQRRFQNFISFLGPAGFGTPDDVSGLEGCQAGFATSPEQPWSDISRGMNRDQPRSRDELQMRAFWRRWHAVMLGERGPTNCSDRPDYRAAAE
jgi:p-cumate 2,3-dioxygenase subunit alpha